MNKLYWLGAIQLSDRANVGDQAFYLSQIIQSGYPVLPGFVISADTWREFLETLHSSESLVADLPDSYLHLDVTNWQQLQQVARRLRQEVLAANLPNHWVNQISETANTLGCQYLILRPSLNISSPHHSIDNFSGLLDAIFCISQPQEIEQGLKQTWSQLFRARSLLYWQKLGINLQQINLAILVQPVENVIASGIFTINEYGIEIQSTYGLGIAIKKGEILPDIYYIDPDTQAIKEQQIGYKSIAYSVQPHGNIWDTELPYEAYLDKSDNCCFSYPVSEHQQQKYCLSDQQIQEIIILGQNLITHAGKIFTINWDIIETNQTSKLYINQINIPESLNPKWQFIKGIGAAKGQVSAPACVILNSSQLRVKQIPKGVILITPKIQTDSLPLLHEVVGIVTEKGGLTSHAAILSRELAIPAVVNVKNVTSLIQSGEKIFIDGEKGEIHNLAETENSYDSQLYIREKLPKISLPIDNQVTKADVINSSLNLTNLPIIATKLLVNISQTSLIDNIRNLPIDGVGLLRSELMILNAFQGKDPLLLVLQGKKSELLTVLYQEIEKFALAFFPQPIFYRSLDWRSPDFTLSQDAEKYTHKSILGEHGTLSYLKNSTVFDLELQALADLQKNGYGNIHLLLPFVRTVEEFVFCRQKVEQAGLTQNSRFQLWIMAEVPSILFLLPEYIKAGVAGISIGTNDLTQLILGINREYGELSHMFDQPHPAVMKAIFQLISTAKAEGIPCSICGQAPVLYPEIIDKLIEWGITSISVEPEAVETTYDAIARAEQRIIMNAARKQLGYL
ncbi:MAG: phosphoenolpyruvate synthase [Sphaerospermopsis sp. SIO1G1]|nr:phosphoenolpyruvate synthase [Sphaerospermopsis sp. SIO1G1]